MSRYAHRRHAGRVLAGALASHAGRDDVVVLALPRGGVPVAFEVARALGAPLDVFVVRKIGVPSHPEVALGAIASGGVQVMNREIVESLRLSRHTIEAVIAVERAELERREHAFRGRNGPLPVAGKTVILVDDGLATGASMRAAIVGLRLRSPKKIVVAVPIAAVQSCEELRGEADEVICGATPEPFYAVGLWYEDFTQTTDSEVRELLALAQHGPQAAVEGP